MLHRQHRPVPPQKGAVGGEAAAPVLAVILPQRLQAGVPRPVERGGRRRGSPPRQAPGQDGVHAVQQAGRVGRGRTVQHPQIPHSQPRQFLRHRRIHPAPGHAEPSRDQAGDKGVFVRQHLGRHGGRQAWETVPLRQLRAEHPPARTDRFLIPRSRGAVKGEQRARHRLPEGIPVDGQGEQLPINAFRLGHKNPPFPDSLGSFHFLYVFFTQYRFSSPGNNIPGPGRRFPAAHGRGSLPRRRWPGCPWSPRCPRR